MATKPTGPNENFYLQLQHLRRDFLGYLSDAADRFGPIVLLRPAPTTRLYLVNDPELVREILVTQADRFGKTAMTRRMVGKYLGRGLVTSEGAAHAAQRKKVQPTFHRTGVNRYVAVIDALTQAQTAGWQAERPIDFESEMTALTLHVISRLLFGEEDELSEAEIGQAMTTFSLSMAQRFRSLPLPDWLPIPRHVEQRKAIAALDEAIYTLIADRIARYDTLHRRSDLLSALLRAYSEGEKPTMSAPYLKIIRDELATLFFAGHETTAKLLTWTIYLLTQHRDVLETLEAELETVLDGRSPTLEDLPRLTYLDQVLKETLRLYPPAWLFDRMPLASVELGGYRVPKGETLYISPYVMQRQATYFEEPARFMPERFRPGWEETVPRYAYFPFGGGSRICIGQGLAELEAKIVISQVVSRFKFELVPGQEIEPEPGATLRPKHGLKLKIGEKFLTDNRQRTTGNV